MAEPRPDFFPDIALTGGTKTQPDAGLQADGWEPAVDKPKGGDFNWLFNRIRGWLKHLVDRLLSAQEFLGTFTPSLDSGGKREGRAASWRATGMQVTDLGVLDVELTPGVVYVVGQRLEHTAQTLADLELFPFTVDDDADTYLSIRADGNIILSSVANGAAEPIPASNFVNFVKIVAVGGDITSIVEIVDTTPVTTLIQRAKVRELIPLDATFGMDDRLEAGWAREFLFVLKTSGDSPIACDLPGAVITANGDAVSVHVEGFSVRDDGDEATIVHFGSLWRVESGTASEVATYSHNSDGLTAGGSTFAVVDSGGGQIAVEVTGHVEEVTTNIRVRVNFSPGQVGF